MRVLTVGSGTKLLERNAEVQALEAAVLGARAGHGHAIVLEGPAGAGKSSLLEAAVAAAHGSGLRVLTARGSELEREFGFGALRQLYERALSRRSAAERERLLRGVALPAERVLAPVELEAVAASDGFATLHAIYWLTVRLAAEAPLLLAVDDVHWVDASSLRALSYLAGRVSDAPVALVAALRPHEPGAPEDLLDALRFEPAATRLALEPLTSRAVSDLVRGRLPDASDEVCAAFADATGGNPFLLRELLAAHAATGENDDDDPAAAVREAAIAPLGSRLARRVARVRPEAPALVAAMAVLGPGGRLGHAATLSGVPAKDAASIARELRRVEILASEDPLTFVHPLISRSIYDALSATERDDLHLAAARLLLDEGRAVEAAAAHLASVPPSGSQLVVETCLQAAEEARRRAAPYEAAQWLERALREGADSPGRAVILEALGVTRATLRETAAIPHLNEALQLADGPRERARVSAVLIEVLAAAGQWEPAIEELERARAEVGEAGREAEVELAAVQAVTMVYDPAFAPVIERERERLEALTEEDGWAARALAAVLTAEAAHRGEVDRTRRLARRALEGGVLFSERGAGSWAPLHAIGGLVTIDEIEWALAASAEHREAAIAQGAVFGQLASLGARGFAHLRLGELATGEAEVRSALELANVAEMPMAGTTGAYFLQEALIERPGHDDLIAFLDATELPPAFARTWSGAHLFMCRGQLRLAARDPRGLADLRAALDVQRGLGWGPAAAPIRAIVALALPASERDEALELAREELELSRATGLPRQQAIALRALGALTAGEPGLELLRESEALAATSPSPLEHARSLVELGAALRRVGQRAEARRKLNLGADFALRCGALRLLERAREELSAAGARPRRIATSGADALTPSERRVADLAARGATNQDIAQELFVSLKTVETHLSSAYAKLGIQGSGARGRLAGALTSKSA